MAKPLPIVCYILHYLRRLKDGKIPINAIGSYSSVQLYPLEYAQQWACVDADEELRDYVEQSIRYDYRYIQQKIALRVPPFVQRLFIQQVVRDLVHQLDAIATSRDSATAKMEAKAKSWDTKSIVFPMECFGRVSPDARLGEEGTEFPGVVVEWLCPRKAAIMPALAHSYILGSQSRIKVVIGLNIRHPGSKKATVSVWRPDTNIFRFMRHVDASVRTVTEQVFRDANGNMVDNPDADIFLHVQDFDKGVVSSRWRKPVGNIRITASTLYSYLEKAEAEAADMKGRSV